MKVIGFNASPRKNGNTATLLQEVLNGAAGKGAETRLVDLNKLKIKGCQACMSCKNDLGKCVQKDDLSPILMEVTDCDAIVFGTPIYWFHLSSQLKALFDRFYCYFKWELDPESGQIKQTSALPAGKKIVIVTSRADQEDPYFFPELYSHLNDWFNMMTMTMNPSSVTYVNHYGSFNEKDSASKNSELLAKARNAGASLV